MTNEDNKPGSADDTAGIGAAVQDTARKLGAQASELGGQVYRQAADAGQYAGRQVEERPMAAVMIAGGLGVLFGYLLGRSLSEPSSIREHARNFEREYLPRRYRSW